MAGPLERAWLLYRQGRHDDAVDHIARHLASEIDDAEAHSLLGLCHSAEKRFDDAERAAREGVARDPLLAFAHYALASVLSDRDKDGEALAAIEEAIRLAPRVAPFHGLRAALLLALRRRNDALAAADMGLAIDPTDNGCLNLRARILASLGRREDAQRTLRTALAEDPEDPQTHANQGWLALERREYDKSLFHFSEALRRNPNFDWARQGLVEALKAKSIFYRPFLTWLLWMKRLTPAQRWGFILAVWFAPKMIRSVGERYPALMPVAMIVGALALVFVLFSWFGGPISDLILATDRFGRAALLPFERRIAYVVGALLGLAIVSIVLFVSLASAEQRTVAACLAGTAVVTAMAVSGVGGCSPGWPRTAGISLAWAIGLAGLAGTALIASPTPALNSVGSVVFGIAILAGLLNTWLLNILVAIRPKR